jgi:hypothetical protein
MLRQLLATCTALFLLLSCGDPGYTIGFRARGAELRGPDASFPNTSEPELEPGQASIASEGPSPSVTPTTVATTSGEDSPSSAGASTACPAIACASNLTQVVALTDEFGSALHFDAEVCHNDRCTGVGIYLPRSELSSDAPGQVWQSHGMSANLEVSLYKHAERLSFRFSWLAHASLLNSGDTFVIRITEVSKRLVFEAQYMATYWVAPLNECSRCQIARIDDTLECVSGLCPSQWLCNPQSQQCEAVPMSGTPSMSPPCAVDLDCPTGQVCSGAGSQSPLMPSMSIGVCVSEIIACTQDLDCNASEYCRGDTHQCQALPTLQSPVACMTDRACPSNYYCNLTTARCSLSL